MKSTLVPNTTSIALPDLIYAIDAVNPGNITWTCPIEFLIL